MLYAKEPGVFGEAITAMSSECEGSWESRARASFGSVVGSLEQIWRAAAPARAPRAEALVETAHGLLYLSDKNIAIESLCFLFSIT